MSQKYEKLKALLKELFQLDQPDLDFGIYRIMHAKADEVTKFLDEDLLPQVKAAFDLYRPADRSAIEREMEKAAAGAQAAGIPPEQSPRYAELRDRLANYSVNVSALEDEVYEHLFGFFRRYYSEGDFLSKRVYKPGVYAIPYEGEEVKLHWANNDQYYIKTSEYLRDYAFRLRPENESDPMRVHFRLVEAAEGEHGNVKSAEGKERKFILAPDNYAAVVDGELVLRFYYRPATVEDWPEADRAGRAKPPAQKDLIRAAVQRILEGSDPALVPWIAELRKPHTKANGEQANYSRLEGHLTRYMARNTFDYFIHKDLGGFLRRELDFYIKNEIMHLDDVENESAPKVEQYLSKIRVVRQIAGKIIAFLAQLEDFQKKLWLKRKFVVETSYCITLDRIPEDFYPEIAANDAQRDEWVRLFAIDELEGYTVPLQSDFLKAHDKLLVDTGLLSAELAERILAAQADLDRHVDGVLIHGDNFQALRLLGRHYRERVKCIYIDPPYNTDSSSIPYKNNYRHSSWLTMMHDRLSALHPTLCADGAIFVSIDKTERTVLEHALDDVFGANNRVEELIWSMNTTNSQVPNYSTNHEYVMVYAKHKPTVENSPDMFREPKPGFEEVMTLVRTLNGSYPSISEIEAELKSLYDGHKTAYREEVEAKGLDWKKAKKDDPWRGLYNYSRAEYRDQSGVLVSENDAKERKARIWVWQAGDASMPATKQSPTTKDPNHPNWRFYRPIHPESKKPTARPKSGWKFAYADDEDSPEKLSFVSLERDNRIVWGPTEKNVPRLKRMLHEVETNIGKSVFQDYSDGEKQTSAMFGRSGVFLAPKHSSFVSRFILHAAKKDSVILDCFGGSGSTAHAVIDLNRDDNGARKYVLMEVGNYFDTVLKPRVLKAAYSRDWRGGKPVSREGVSHCVKVVRLESYEDVLNNLEVRRTAHQRGLLELPEAQGPDGLQEQYILKYMLESETHGSPSLLKIQSFSDPTAYKLRVKAPGSDESREMNIDLIETFNYLLGLCVEHIAVPQQFSAEFERDGEGRLRLKGRLKLDAGGPWWFRTVTGCMPDGRRTLIIWRRLTGVPEQDNLVLDEWFERQGYSSRDQEFQLIYVNGGNNLENSKAPDDTWKVRLIEEDFHRLMFADTEEA